MIWNLEEHIVKKIKKPVIYIWVAMNVFVLIIAITPLSNFLASQLIVEPLLKKSHVIAVLGGGVYKNGVLGSATSLRVIRGVVLYKQGYSDKVFFTGATVKELDKKIVSATKGDTSSSLLPTSNEGLSMFSTVSAMGLPPEAIAYDDKATHTYANMIELKKYMDINSLSTCMIVTSPTHMYRASLSAKKAGLNCSPAPVEDYTGEIGSFIGRINLFYTVMWEYAGLVFYKLYGYI